MKILALNWQDLKNPYSGGAEVHLEELLRRIAARGHSVTLFCSNYDGGKTEEVVEGVRILRAGNRYNFNWIARGHIKRLLQQEKYDLFLEDINKIPFYSPRYVNIPSIIIIPHLFSTAVFKEINFVLGTYIYLFELPITSFYRRKQFCVISESTADDLVRRGLTRSQVSVIHCGIDSGLYNNNKGYDRFEQPTVLYLGRIKKYKSIQHLIRAFAIVRQLIGGARLAIVGSGDYVPALKREVAELNLENVVEFPGFVSREKKVENLCRSHVMVYPSLREGWGLTNIEANSCGTPVIAANSPGLCDSVKDGYSGLLYPYGDIEVLADKIVFFLTRKDDHAEYAANALKWASQFNWDSAAEKFLDLCKEVARKR